MKTVNRASVLIPVEILQACRRLREAGRLAYIVGGAVRDAMLGRAVADWDLATDASHEVIRSLFADTPHFVIQANTVTLLAAGGKVEITPFRGMTNTLEEDLSHRDFTINAIAWEPVTDRLVDPHHGGADLANRLVRAVQDPDARFREDPLRLLRAIRLAGELRLKIEARTLQSVSRLAPLIQQAAMERIREEILRILLIERTASHLVRLRQTGILAQIFPELMAGYRKRQPSAHRYTILRHAFETVDRVPCQPVLRMAALLHDVGKPGTRRKEGDQWTFHGHALLGARIAEVILRRLRLSRSFVERTSHLIRHHMVQYDDAWTDGAVRRFIRRVGKDSIPDLLTLRRADVLAHGPGGNSGLHNVARFEKRIDKLLREPLPLESKDLAVDGGTVMDLLGIGPGPRIGRILNHLLEIVADDPSLNREEKLREIILEIQSP